MPKVKYNKAARAYVITIQKAGNGKKGIYEVTLEHLGGNTSIPHGYVEAVGKDLFITYMFAPGHSGSYEHAQRVGQSTTKQEAIKDVYRAWEQGVNASITR